MNGPWSNKCGQFQGANLNLLHVFLLFESLIYLEFKKSSSTLKSIRKRETYLTMLKFYGQEQAKIWPMLRLAPGTLLLG